MKQKLLLKTMLLLFALIAGSNFVWADTETYTFTSKSWAAKNSANQEANWTSGKDGNALTSGQGIQVTTGASGANGTSPTSFDDISEIVVTYCTNSSSGVGTIKVQVGTGNEKSFSVTKPSSGGTTLKTATFTYSTTETGYVKVTADCTTNSVYIYSVKITYTPSGGGGSDPSITASNVSIAQDAENGSIAYTLNNATGNVSASITTGDWLTLGTITSSTVPFTCSANTGAQRTATVTLSFTGATDKIVTITQDAKTVTAPTFNPEGGSYMQGTGITLTSEGNTIYYNIKTDGTTPSDPTNASTEYTSPIILGSGTIKIKAIAYDTYGNASSVVTRTYTGIAPASLPFSWTGTSSAGKDDLAAKTGVDLSLGSDYAASNAPYRLKFDGVGRNVTIYTNGKPECVYFTVKLLGGKCDTGSKIKVQGSADGLEFTDIEEFTMKGAANATFEFATSNAFAATHRAVKLTMSSKDQNVGVGTIAVAGVSIPITPAKEYTTLTSVFPLDFTGLGLEAYIVKDDDLSDNAVTLTQVNKVPANTGLVLKASSTGSPIDVPLLTAAADDVTGNLMAGSATATTAIAANGGYILSEGAFHPANAGNLPAGKAYLAISASAPILNLDFGGTTGISTTNFTNDMNNSGEVYNLNGQRVANPTKGLYIVNGRKVVIK